MLIACAAMALTAVSCGGEASDDDRTTSADAPTAQEVLEQEFPDIDKQNAAAAVRKFYDVLGKTPKEQPVGAGCIVGDRLYSGGHCKEFRIDEMAPEICRLLSKEVIDKNFRELYPNNSYPSNPPVGVDKTDDPKDFPQRMACLQWMGIFLRRMEDDDGFEKAKQAKIVAAQVKGDRGTVTVAFPGGKTTTVDVVKQKDKWRFAKFYGRVEKRGKAEEPGSPPPSSDLPVLPSP